MIIIGGSGTANGITNFSSPATFQSTLQTTGRGISLASLPVGSVVQVVTGTTSTQVTGTSTTYVDTGLSASITPNSSTNKILVLVSQQATWAGGSNAGGGIKLVRGSTDVYLPATDSTGPYEIYLANSGTGNQLFHRYNLIYLDSPATTSSTTYKTQVRSYNNTHTYYINQYGGVTSSTSTITLMEIVA